MIKNIFSNTATLLLPALAAGILASCKNEVKADAAQKQDAAVLETVKPLQQPEYTDDGFAPIAYTIPYLGRINGEPVELQLTRTTTDTVYGNYISKYDEWGSMGGDIGGKVTNGNFVLRDLSFATQKPTFKFKLTDKVLTGTLSADGKKQDISLNPAVSIAKNPQLTYRYRLVTENPTEADDYPVTDNKYKVLTQVEVYNKNQLLQSISVDRQAISGNEVLTLSDYNFDGYLDLVIDVRYPGAIKRDWAMITYLYDKEQGTFIESKALNYYRVVNMYYGKKEIMHGDADGSGNEENETLKWVNDTLLTVKRVYMTMDDPDVHHQEYTIENNKSILTKEYTE